MFGIFTLLINYILPNRNYQIVIFLILTILLFYNGQKITNNTIVCWNAQIEEMQSSVNQYFIKYDKIPAHINVVMIDKPPKNIHINHTTHMYNPLRLYATYIEPKAWANKVISEIIGKRSKKWAYDGTIYKDMKVPSVAISKITYENILTKKLKLPRPQLSDKTLLIDLNNIFKNRKKINLYTQNSFLLEYQY